MDIKGLFEEQSFTVDFDNLSENIIDKSFEILKILYINRRNLPLEGIMILNQRKNIDVIVDILTKMVVEKYDFETAFSLCFIYECDEERIMSEERIKQCCIRNSYGVIDQIDELKYSVEELKYNFNQKIDELEEKKEDSFLKIISVLVPKIIEDSLKNFF